LILCIVLGSITKILQRKFIDKRELEYNREKMKEMQKKMNELMKIGSEKSRKELELLQTEMLEVNTKILNQSMKLMWITMPIFLVAFTGMNHLYGGKSLESFIALPMFEGFNMLNPLSWIPVGLETSGIGFFKMYFFYYLIVSLGLNLVEKVYDKKIKPKMKK